MRHRPPHPTFIKLIGAIAVLNVLHSIDHVTRGDFHVPIDAQSIAFLAIIGAIFAVLGIGLWLYRAGRIGPRFWTIAGAVGLTFGWLSHFSPSTDQPMHVIFESYHSPFAGSLAVACLLILMAFVSIATIYSAFLRRTSLLDQPHSVSAQK